MKICILAYTWIFIIEWCRIIKLIGQCHCEEVEVLKSKIKLITRNGTDPSKFDENDNSKYKIEEDNVQVRYKISQEIDYIELKDGDVSIWKFDSAQNNENRPVEVSVNYYANNVRIKTQNGLYIYGYRNNEWDLIVEAELDTEPQNNSKQESIIIDDSGPSKSSSQQSVDKLNDWGIKIVTKDKNNITKINSASDLFVIRNNGSTTFKLRDSSIICNIVYKDEIIWKDKFSREGVNYPKVIHILMDEDNFCFDSSPLFFMYRRVFGPDCFLNKYLALKDSKTPFKDVSYLIFILKIKNTSDPNGNTNDVEIVRNSPVPFSKKFKNDEHCIEIKCGDDLVWNHDSVKDPDNYPSEIYVNFVLYTHIKIRLGRKTYIYSYSSDKWVFASLYINESTKETNLEQSESTKETNLEQLSVDEDVEKSLILQSTIYP